MGKITGGKWIALSQIGSGQHVGPTQCIEPIFEIGQDM